MRSRQTTLWLLCLSASDAFLLPPKSISTSLHNSLNDENYDISNAHFVKKQPQHKQVQLQPGIIGVVPANKDDKNKNNNNNHEASRSPPPSEPLLDDVTMKLRNGKTQSQSEKESHATPQISQFHAPKKYKQIRTFSGGYQLVEDKTPTTPVQKPSSNTSWRSGAFSTSVNLNPAITTAQSLPQRQTPIKPASPLSISPVTQHQTPPKRAEFVNSWRSQAISSPTPKNRLKTLGEEPLDRNTALGMEVPIKAKKSNILRENNADQRMQHPVADKVIGRSKRLTPIGDPKEPLDKNAIQGLQVPIKAKYAEPKYSKPTKLIASPIDGSKVLDKNVIQGLQVELEATDSSLNEDSPLQAKVDLPGKPKHLLDKDTIQGPRVEIRTQSVPGANASLTARAAADEEADPKHSLGKSAIQGQDLSLKAPKANLWALAARSQAAKEILASQNLQKSSVVKTPSKSTEIKSNTNQTPIREPHLHSNLYKTQGTTDDKTFSEFISNTTSSSSLSDADEMSEKTSVETSDIPTMPKFQQVKTASGFKMIDYLEYMDDLRPKFRVTRVDYPETWLRPGATMQTDDTTQHFVSTSTEGEETISNRTVLDRQKMLRQDISRTDSTISNKIELSAPQSLAEVNKTASNMTKLMDQPLPLQSKLMTPKIKQVRTPAGFQMVTAGEDDMTELVVKRVDYPETWKKDITSRATNVKLVQVQTDAGFEMIEAPEDHTEQNVSAPIGLKRADYPETWQKPISNGNTKAYTSGLTENKASIGTSVPIHAPGKGTLIPKKYKKVKTFSGGFEFVEDDGIDQPSLTKPKPTNLKVKQVQTPAGFQMVTFDNENEPETQDAYSSVRRADYPETWQRSTSTKANEGVNVNALKNPAAEGLSVPVQAPARVSEWSRDDKNVQVKPDQLIDVGTRAVDGTYRIVSASVAPPNVAQETLGTQSPKTLRQDLDVVRADMPQTWRRSLSAKVTRPDLSGPHVNTATIGTSVTVRAPMNFPPSTSRQTPIPDQDSLLAQNAVDGTFVKVSSTMAAENPVKNQPFRNNSDGLRGDFPQTWRKSPSKTGIGQILSGPRKNTASIGTSMTVRGPMDFASESSLAKNIPAHADQSISVGETASGGRDVDMRVPLTSRSISSSSNLSKEKFPSQPDQSASLAERALQGTFVDVSLPKTSMRLDVTAPKTKISTQPDQSTPIGARALEGTFVDVSVPSTFRSTILSSNTSKEIFPARPDQSVPLAARALEGTFVDVSIPSTSTSISMGLDAKALKKKIHTQPDQSIPIGSRALEGTFVNISVPSTKGSIGLNSNLSKKKFSTLPDQSAPLGARALYGTFVDVSLSSTSRLMRLNVDSLKNSNVDQQKKQEQLRLAEAGRKAQEESVMLKAQKEAQLEKQVLLYSEMAARLRVRDEVRTAQDARQKAAQRRREEESRMTLELKRKAAEDAAHRKTQRQSRLAEAKRKAEEEAELLKMQQLRMAEEKRKAKEDAATLKVQQLALIAEARRKAEEETTRLQALQLIQLAESRRKAKAEAAQLKLEEEARQTETKRKAVEEAAQLKAHQQARLAEANRRVEEEAVQYKVEKQARLAEAKRRAEEEARHTQEKRRIAEEETSRVKAQDAARLSQQKRLKEEEEDFRRKVEEEARLVQETRRKVEEKARLAELMRRHVEEAQTAQETRRQAEEETARFMAEEARLAQETRRNVEEETARFKAEEARLAQEMRRQEEEETARLRVEEDARLAREIKRRAEEEAARLKLEEDDRLAQEIRQKAEEEAVRRKTEEGARLAQEMREAVEQKARLAEEIRQKEEEAARRKATEDERLAEAMRHKAEEEAVRLKAKEEARIAQEIRRTADEEAARRKSEEETLQLQEIRRTADEEAARRKSEEEALQLQEIRRTADEEAARRKAEEEIRLAQEIKRKGEEEVAWCKADENTRLTQEARHKVDQDSARIMLQEPVGLDVDATHESEKETPLKARQETRLIQQQKRQERSTTMTAEKERVNEFVNKNWMLTAHKPTTNNSMLVYDEKTTKTETLRSHLAMKEITHKNSAMNENPLFKSPQTAKKVWKQLPTPGGFKLVQVVETVAMPATHAVPMAVIPKIEVLNSTDITKVDAMLLQEMKVEEKEEEKRFREKERESRHEKAKVAVAKIKAFFDKKSPSHDTIVDEWLNYEKRWSALPTANTAMNEEAKDLIKKRAKYYFAQDMEPKEENIVSPMDAHNEQGPARATEPSPSPHSSVPQGTPFFAQRVESTKNKPSLDP